MFLCVGGVCGCLCSCACVCVCVYLCARECAVKPFFNYVNIQTSLAGGYPDSVQYLCTPTNAVGRRVCRSTHTSGWSLPGGLWCELLSQLLEDCSVLLPSGGNV